MDGSELDALFDRIEADLTKARELALEEYGRGERNAIDRIMKAVAIPGVAAIPAVTGSATEPSETKGKPSDDGKKPRAPTGASKKLVVRVLAEKGSASPSEILEAANTDTEKLVSYSAIRLELYRGRDEGRYVSDGGRWKKT